MEVCCSYVLNVEASNGRLKDLAAAEPNLTALEVEWGEVNQEEFWQSLFERLGLQFSKEKVRKGISAVALAARVRSSLTPSSQLAQVVAGGKKNERREEKEAKCVKERGLDYYAAEVEKYKRVVEGVT